LLVFGLSTISEDEIAEVEAVLTLHNAPPGHVKRAHHLQTVLVDPQASA
jgi:hypothetical protein